MVRRALDVARQQAVGMVALFVALGGTSYAVATGSIDSRELKNNSIRTQDVRNRTLLEKDFKRGQLKAGRQGPRGAAGAQGPTGPTGLTGPTGPDGVPATRLCARVNGGSGEPLSGSGVTSSSRTAVGSYTVTFSRSVQACAVLATAGVGTPAVPGDVYQGGSRASVNTGGSGSQVVVNTVGGGPSLEDRSFFIAAFC
jgi:hypothetical protein